MTSLPPQFPPHLGAVHVVADFRERLILLNLRLFEALNRFAHGGELGFDLLNSRINGGHAWIRRANGSLSDYKRMAILELWDGT